MNKPLFFILAVLIGIIHGGSSDAASIAGTKHNLSTSGTGTVKSATEQRICVFCHTPHRSMGSVRGLSVPLWNHSLSTASYTLYQSRTLLSPTSPNIQPDGASKVCLSCHDGTVAITSIANTGGSKTMMSMRKSSQLTPEGKLSTSASSNLGTELSGHHPISIAMNATLLKDKESQCKSGAVTQRLCLPTNKYARLARTKNSYPNNVPSLAAVDGLQCTTCHDPHEDKLPGKTFFLRAVDKDNNWDIMCTDCHRSCSSPCTTQ